MFGSDNKKLLMNDSKCLCKSCKRLVLMHELRNKGQIKQIKCRLCQTRKHQNQWSLFEVAQNL